jgi:hypothetical protein
MPLHLPQNRKAECNLCTLNNMVRTMLMQSHAPSPIWAKALNIAIHVLNHHPCRELFFGSPTAYDHLCIFGCLCFPNMTATLPHKLIMHFAPCAFLGYPTDHKGYRCFNLATRKVITSRHVVFDETQFPFIAVPVSSLGSASSGSAPPPSP